MGETRHVGAVVLMAAAVSIVASYTIYRLCNDDLPGRAHLELAEVPFLDSSAADAESSPEFPPRQIAQQMRRPTCRVVPALQTDETADSGPGSAKLPAPQPQKVPVPTDAVPMTEEDQPGEIHSPGADAVRGVIDQELSGATREERDIWFHELKSLPAGVVRDLLQVRKQLRSLPQSLQGSVSVKDHPAVRATEIVAEPASQVRRSSALDWSGTKAAFEEACAVAQHNLVNSTTPGFKRFKVFMVDAPSVRWTKSSDSAEDLGQESRVTLRTEGARLAPLTLDLEQGTVLQTDRPMDLAIDGEGFFVASMNGRSVYTRCGVLTLDSRRQVCLAASETLAVLQPVIVIPADVLEIQVLSTGKLMVLRKPATAPEVAGQIHLARFANPDRLQPVGGTMLVASALSGSADVDAPEIGGRGVIQQGCLEQSNVDPETELSAITQWQTLLKSLPAASHPVTARGDEPSSR